MVSTATKLTEDGIRKAAILVASLDRDAADAVLELLLPEQAQQVRYAVVAMNDIPSEERDRVLGEFASRRTNKPIPSNSGVELAGSLADSIEWNFENEGDSTYDERKPSAPPFLCLRETEGGKIAKLLVGERPQTIALVLSHLAPEQAGKVLVNLSPDLQVLRRLVDLEEADPIILRDVEKALEGRLSQHIQIQRRRVAGISAVSGILEESSGEVSLKILDILSRGDKRLAQKLSPPSIRFEELEDMDEALVASAFCAVDPGWIMPALLGASPEMIECGLSGLPYDQAEEIRQKLQDPGPIRLSDVEAARCRIAESARKILFTRNHTRSFAA
jgi:flagellar motor switch protein FliG